MYRCQPLATMLALLRVVLDLFRARWALFHIAPFLSHYIADERRLNVAAIIETFMMIS